MATPRASRFLRGEPRQPEGMPQGKHKSSKFATKEEKDSLLASCQCGGCHPNSKANRGRIIYI